MKNYNNEAELEKLHESSLLMEDIIFYGWHYGKLQFRGLTA